MVFNTFYMKLEKPPNRVPIQEVIEDLNSESKLPFIKQSNKFYWYWDELKYKKNQPYEDPIKTWSLIKLHRIFNSKNVRLNNYSFKYYLTQEIHKDLHNFDLVLMGDLFRSPISKNDQSAYLSNSILEEAIASSQIEGAATTTEVAWKMLRSGRKPRDESEQMIFNNQKAINFIIEESDRKLTPDFIIELHQIMTINTSAEESAGDFRTGPIYVTDPIDGKVAYIPPDHLELSQLINALCEFSDSDEFIHPIVKAAMIHFFVGWIHPFRDGNGRTARALFYWYLIKEKYTLVKSVSISRAILDSRIQYDKAFLKVENDDNDLTYFINYAIKSLRVAFESLIKYRDKKKNEKEIMTETNILLSKSGLNERQAKFISYLYSKETALVSLSTYVSNSNITRPTATRDLKELESMELIKKYKIGREVSYEVNSREKIKKMLTKNIK